MARPTKNNPNGEQISPKMTDEAIQKLEQAFAIDATVGEACFYADISTSTYYNWVGANPKLLDKFERLRNKPVLTARQSVVKGLGDPEFALKYLKNKRNKEFSERNDVDVTTGGEKLNSMSDLLTSLHANTGGSDKQGVESE